MAEEGFKRKLAAILSADVEGYSRLMDDNEEATVRTLTTYRTAIADLVQQFRGRVVDTPGDNILAEFTSVVDAVNCAVEIQRELAERNVELPYNRKMEFRIGVNLGDVIEEEGRIYGDGVNIAARVEAMSKAGGICISGRAYDQVENKLGLQYENLGEHQVKNIARPIRVYRVLSFPGAAAHRVVKAKEAIQRKWRKAALVIVAILIVGVGAVTVWKFHLRPSPPLEVASVEKMAFPLPDKPSIAVLPFDNMSGDPAQEYFSDGITEDLITDLSSISGIIVIARTSTFLYKGKNVKVRQIAEELGVQYILEGSVRKADNRVRINAQLIDSISGKHLWAKRYDGKLGQVFDLQDQITQKIVSALAVKLTTREQERLELKYTDNVEAYSALMQGLEHYRRITPNDFADALSYFKKAVELDPNYGLAYALLASLHYWAADLTFHISLGLPWIEARLLSHQYLEKAKQTSYPGVPLVAVDIFLKRRQYKDAIAVSERAIALNPNNASGYMEMGRALNFVGRPNEAVDFIKRAIRLDPLCPPIYLWQLGLAHFCMGQLEKAVTMLERAVSLYPQVGALSGLLAATYAHLGRKQEAQAALENYTVKRGWSPSLRDVMHWYPFKDQEVADRFAAGLLKAGLPGEPSGYYKIYEENRLTGEEIRDLIFGRTVTGLDPASGLQWRLDFTKDGKITARGPGALYSALDSGTGWSEGDMLCSKFKWNYKDLKLCASIFRNPNGSPEMKNEYLQITDFGIIPFSPDY